MKKYGEKRFVIMEKFKIWNYVDSFGNRIWLNKYGDIVKKQSKDGIYFNGSRIKIKWTPEMAQYLEAYHSIDAEAELTVLLSEELAKEINKSIIGGILEMQERQFII
jgi:hypothetical protein